MAVSKFTQLLFPPWRLPRPCQFYLWTKTFCFVISSDLGPSSKKSFSKSQKSTAKLKTFSFSQFHSLSAVFFLLRGHVHLNLKKNTIRLGHRLLLRGIAWWDTTSLFTRPQVFFTYLADPQRTKSLIINPILVQTTIAFIRLLKMVEATCRSVGFALFKMDQEVLEKSNFITNVQKGAWAE